MLLNNNLLSIKININDRKNTLENLFLLDKIIFTVFSYKNDLKNILLIDETTLNWKSINS